MGTSTDAVLAYGYNLGGADDWAIHEIDEYDSLDPARFSWYDDDNDDNDFREQAERHLLASVGFTEEPWTEPGYYEREKEAKARIGVQFETYCSDSAPMHLLAAHVITVSRGGCDVLNLPALAAMPTEHGWDDKLRHACEVLGITPKQEQPGWLLVSYWG